MLQTFLQRKDGHPPKMWFRLETDNATRTRRRQEYYSHQETFWRQQGRPAKQVQSGLKENKETGVDLLWWLEKGDGVKFPTCRQGHGMVGTPRQQQKRNHLVFPINLPRAVKHQLSHTPNYKQYQCFVICQLEEISKIFN